MGCYLLASSNVLIGSPFSELPILNFLMNQEDVISVAPNPDGPSYCDHHHL